MEEQECYQDADCPPKQACYDGECKNPCLRNRPCAENAECTVKPDLPLRVQVCTCNPGYSGNGIQRCELISKLGKIYVWAQAKSCFTRRCLEAPVTIGCQSDRECPSSRVCENRRCVNPCRTDNPCSPSAICIAKNHKAECSCRAGMTGDPYSGCTTSTYSAL